MEEYLVQILTNQMMLLEELAEKHTLAGKQESANTVEHCICYSLELVKKEIGE